VIFCIEIRERWPCHVVVWPVLVQGPDAPSQIIKALKGLETGQLIRPDIIIVARGGGSVEDLWAFNDEALARQVSAMTIPIISAIGHETDTTLIDFVSDRRAPTPTAAAEMATPVLSELRYSLMDLGQRLTKSIERDWTQKSERLSLLARTLSDPQDLYLRAEQRFDFLKMRLENQLKTHLSKAETQAAAIIPRLQINLLNRVFTDKNDKLIALGQRLNPAMSQTLGHKAQQARLPELNVRLHKAVVLGLRRATERLSHSDMMLKAVDPERPLALGFARITRNQEPIFRASKVKEGDILKIHFQDASLGAVAGPPIKSGSERTPISTNPKPSPSKKASPDTKDQGQLF